MIVRQPDKHAVNDAYRAGPLPPSLRPRGFLERNAYLVVPFVFVGLSTANGWCLHKTAQEFNGWSFRTDGTALVVRGPTGQDVLRLNDSPHNLTVLGETAHGAGDISLTGGRAPESVNMTLSQPVAPSSQMISGSGP